MTYAVIVSAHNEETFLPRVISSLMRQTTLAKEVILVDDNSTDSTSSIMDKFAKKHPSIRWTQNLSSANHQPGAKVIRAFNHGMTLLKTEVEVVVKLDADIELPAHYFTELLKVFKKETIGIAGGFCLEQNSRGNWKINHPMGNDHVRGAIKAYRMSCFKAIGGLREAMGWDTIDEHLARYFGYQVKTIEGLAVRHLRPLGKRYTKFAIRQQGKAFYQMRYGVLWSFLAAVKWGWSKKSFFGGCQVLWGYYVSWKQKSAFLVTVDQGKFIRAYRLKQQFNQRKTNR